MKRASPSSRIDDTQAGGGRPASIGSRRCAVALLLLASGCGSRAQIDVPGADDEPPAEPPIRPLRILLAEDNRFNQQVAIATLEREGHTVTLAENGREALDRIERQTFDVVLMDVQMPEMDGLSATRAIRDIPMPRRLPILAMTANAMKADLDACLAAGMDDHVTKPIERKLLLQTLRRWLPARRDADERKGWPEGQHYGLAEFVRSADLQVGPVRGLIQL